MSFEFGQPGAQDPRTGGGLDFAQQSSDQKSSVLLSLPFASNGYLLSPTANMDLWLVADDLTSGQNWAAHGGTAYSATVTGTPSVGNESPFYPRGDFAGSGFRKATGDFAAGAHYDLAAGSQNTLAADVTYEVLFKSGSLPGTETLIGHYFSGRGGWQLRTNTTSAVFDVFDTTGATLMNAAIAISPYTYYLVTFSFTLSTKTGVIYLNGGSSNSGNTASAIPANTTDPLGIGRRAGDNSSPLVTGQIIEIMRHAGLAMGSSQIAQRFQTLAGIQDGRGTYPSAYTRASAATVTINPPPNSKLFSLGAGWPRVDASGYYSEGSATNLIVNSTFVKPLATGWTTTVAGTTTAALNSSFSFSNVGGQACKIICDSAAADGYISQNVTVAISTAYFLSIDHAETPSAQTFYRIRNTATLNYLQSNGTWAAGSAWVAIGSSSGSLFRAGFGFTTEGSGTTLTIDVGNGGAPAQNQSKSLFIGHIQLEANTYATSRIVTAGATGSRSGDILNFSTSVFDATKGSAQLRFTPEYGSWPTARGYLCVGNTSYLLYSSSSAVVNSHDGTSTVNQATTWTQDVPKDIESIWGGSSRTVIDVTGNASTGGSFDGLFNGTLIGVGTDGTSFQPNGHVQNVVIRNR